MSLDKPPVRLGKKPDKPPINWRFILGVCIFVFICILLVIIAYQSRYFFFYNGGVEGVV